MSDQLKMQMMLSNIQNQINAMNNTVAPIPAAPVQSVFNPIPDINSLVKQAVQAEISKLTMPAPTTAPVTPPPATPKIINDPVPSLLPIIGAAFTKEQQEWISQPQNLMGIPGFLMGSDGKDILVMALDAYQQFCSAQKVTT